MDTNSNQFQQVIPWVSKTLKNAKSKCQYEENPHLHVSTYLLPFIVPPAELIEEKRGLVINIDSSRILQLYRKVGRYFPFFWGIFVNFYYNPTKSGWSLAHLHLFGFILLLNLSALS